MNGRFAIVAVLLSGCYMSFGSPPDAECVEDAECREGFECSESGRCLCSASTCTGCCSVDRHECRAGHDDNACGSLGETCENCETLDLSCHQGECRVVGSCSDECEPEGARECPSENSWRECDDHDDDGCLEWSEPSLCDPTEACVSGICVAECGNECSGDGERDCENETRWRECGYIESLDCYQWVLAADCPDGQTCADGHCSASCGPTDPCLTGQTCLDGECVDCAEPCIVTTRRCDDESHAVQECQTNSDGCDQWVTVIPCDDDERCFENDCWPLCVRECELRERECLSALTYRECREVSGCPEWSARTSCRDEYPYCEAGLCQYRIEVNADESLAEVISADGTSCRLPHDMPVEETPGVVPKVSLGDVDGDNLLEIVALIHPVPDWQCRFEILSTACVAEGTYNCRTEPYRYVYATFDLDDISGDGNADIIAGGSILNASGASSGCVFNGWRFDPVSREAESLFDPVRVHSSGCMVHEVEVDPGARVVHFRVEGVGMIREYCLNYRGVMVTCP